MDLILWRHAEAEPGSPDADRELTGKGRKQAKRVAAWLKERLKGRYLMLVSPTARTRQTALGLTDQFELSEALAPNSTPRRMLKAAAWPETDGTVILVGHRPGLNRLASLLLTGSEREWEFKKGGIWWLQNRDDGEPAYVRAVIGPRDL